MMAKTEKGLQTIINALIKTMKEYDIMKNVKKTKVMRVCRNGSKREDNSINITIERQGKISESFTLFEITHLR